MHLTLTQMILVGVIALLVVGAIAYAVVRKRRADHLRAKFGPEYDRAVGVAGGALKGESELRRREKRLDAFNIQPLSPAQHERYATAWKAIQTQFVDAPESAVLGADELLGQVMAARGYPVGDFEQRAADLSVDHAEVVQNYRSGHAIAVRQSHGQATTEDLRQAMLSYRNLFDELAGQQGGVATSAAA